MKEERKYKKMGGTYILNAVCMSLVLHDGVGRKVEDSAQCVSDAGSGRLVTGGFVPDGDNVLLHTENTEAKYAKCIHNICVCVAWSYLEAHRHHSPTDLLSHHELLPEHGQDQVLPAPGRETFS